MGAGSASKVTDNQRSVDNAPGRTPPPAAEEHMIAAGWIAILLALVAVATVVSIALFFVIGGPFGTLNDAGNGLTGILTAVLALSLVSRAGGWPGVVASVIGAAFAVWGSWLVMSGATGFVLAGFVSTIGFSFIGVWLAVVGRLRAFDRRALAGHRHRDG